jgi:ribonuclease HI
MKNIEQTASVYCDGGVISRNPSTDGGTYAYFFLDAEGKQIGTHSGFVLPNGVEFPDEYESTRYLHLQTVSNNVTELAAVVFALMQLPDGFEGTLYSDSYVTLCRMRNKKPSWVGVPLGLKEEAEIEKKRHPDIKYVLLDGHPNRDQLASGIGKRGNPCSQWNVACDKRCGELAKAFLAQKKEGDEP